MHAILNIVWLWVIISHCNASLSYVMNLCILSTLHAPIWMFFSDECTQTIITHFYHVMSLSIVCTFSYVDRSVMCFMFEYNTYTIIQHTSYQYACYPFSFILVVWVCILAWCLLSNVYACYTYTVRAWMLSHVMNLYMLYLLYTVCACMNVLSSCSCIWVLMYVCMHVWYAGEEELARLEARLSQAEMMINRVLSPQSSRRMERWAERSAPHRLCHMALACDGDLQLGPAINHVTGTRARCLGAGA